MYRVCVLLEHALCPSRGGLINYCSVARNDGFQWLLCIFANVLQNCAIFAPCALLASEQ